jgi:two-component system capsular synthesis sensor histidine kinase RcsC
METPGERLGKLNILVVDDSFALRAAIADALSLAGHGVMMAIDGDHALDLFHPDVYDVVITDFAMPQINGLELATIIRERAPRQRIVLLSGNADALPPGEQPIDLLLRKPISLAALTSAIALLGNVPHIGKN